MIVPEVKEKLSSLNARDAVIVGLEAHVCIQQTALDLIEMGYNVHLCVDAISSQSLTGARAERERALERTHA